MRAEVRTVLSLVLSSLCLCVWGQESRGTIQGRILDPSGAAVPGATLMAVNTDTNVAVKIKSGADGTYSIPYLLPGPYKLEVTAPGFRSLVRAGIELRISDRLLLDLSIQIGEPKESVTITAEVPLLQTATANTGQVIDARRVAELPNRDGSPAALLFLSPGAIYTYPGGSAIQAPMFMQNAITNSNINGTPRGSTDFTMDGVPNTQTSIADYGNGMLNSPPADLVQEFKMETAYDASVGHTSGSVVNFTLKTGTNNFHGTALFVDREPDWQANSFISNRAGQPRPRFYYDRWSATFTGPIRTPKVYDGRNRTFFSFGYEEFHTGSPQTASVATVPTAAQLRGDFSQLLAIDPQYQIYDPATTVPAGSGRYMRQRFPGNIIPASRISPIALAILREYPSPNSAGAADGTNNLALSYFDPRYYVNHIGRLDQNLSDRHRFYARFSGGDRTDGPYRQYWGSPAVGETWKGPVLQAAVDDVYTLTPTLIMNIRYGFNRYDGSHTPLVVGVSPAGLSFPGSTVAQLTQAVTMFPAVSTSGLTGLGGEGLDIENTQNHSLFLNFTKQKGAHSFKFGSDIRSYQENMFTPAKAGGSFTFGTAYTQGPLDNSVASPSGMGQGLAALLLGQPTGGFIDRNDNQAATSTYWSAFLHDNWRLSTRLTVDLGLRWEYEGPVTDRYNRSVRGFDSGYVQPIEAAALAKYAAAPDASLPLDQLKLRGGLLFAGVRGQPRELWNKAWWNFAPRLGMAYKLDKDSVLRAGFGIFPIEIGVPGKNFAIQSGYNQQTALVPTLDSGQTFIATLANPFPNGILPAVGNSLGQQTFLGQSISYYNPETRTPYSMRWSANVQRMLPRHVLLEAGYVGNKAVKLMIAHPMNALPDNYLSSSPVRDQATINYLTAQIPNPMAGLLPSTSLNGATIARQQSLLPRPQFGSITMYDFQGYSWYHSLQARLERRFSAGFTVMGAYTFSKTMEATGYLNGGDPVPSQWISTIDRPHNITFSGLFDLPFGRGRKLFNTAHALVDGFIGGWTIGAVWRFTSGPPLGFGNALLKPGYTLKDIPLPEGQRTLNRWFNTGVVDTISGNQLSSSLVRLSPLLAGVRGDYDNELDLAVMKKIRLLEGYYLELKLEAQNAPNHAFGFAPPNTSPTSAAFGTVTGINGTARTVQVAMKIVF